MSSLWDIVEFLLEFLDIFLSWRFYVGLVSGIALCLIVMHFVPDDTWSWILGLPFAIAGLVWGFIWDRRCG